MLVLVLGACGVSKIPSKKLPQYQYNINTERKGDSIKIILDNPLKCPLRFYLSSKNQYADSIFKSNIPLVVKAEANKIFSFYYPFNDPLTFTHSSKYGDPFLKVELNKIQLPFVENKKYRINQGYNGQFSHNSVYSRYALDFALKERYSVFSYQWICCWCSSRL